jgi:hypothetical protein
VVKTLSVIASHSSILRTGASPLLGMRLQEGLFEQEGLRSL